MVSLLEAFIAVFKRKCMCPNPWEQKKSRKSKIKQDVTPARLNSDRPIRPGAIALRVQRDEAGQKIALRLEWSGDYWTSEISLALGANIIEQAVPIPVEGDGIGWAIWLMPSMDFGERLRLLHEYGVLRREIIEEAMSRKWINKRLRPSRWDSRIEEDGEDED